MAQFRPHRFSKQPVQNVSISSSSTPQRVDPSVLVVSPGSKEQKGKGQAGPDVNTISPTKKNYKRHIIKNGSDGHSKGLPEKRASIHLYSKDILVRRPEVKTQYEEAVSPRRRSKRLGTRSQSTIDMRDVRSAMRKNQNLRTSPEPSPIKHNLNGINDRENGKDTNNTEIEIPKSNSSEKNRETRVRLKRNRNRSMIVRGPHASKRDLMLSPPRPTHETTAVQEDNVGVNDDNDVIRFKEALAKTSRESEMRKEIMQLQKESLLSLREENKQLAEENRMVIALVQDLQGSQSQALLENARLRQMLDKDGTVDLITHERDVALQRIEDLRASNEDMKSKLQEFQSEDGSSKHKISVSEEANQKLRALEKQNQKLQKKLAGMYTHQIQGDVYQLIGDNLRHDNIEEAYGAAVERLAELTQQNSTLQTQIEELRLSYSSATSPEPISSSFLNDAESPEKKSFGHSQPRTNMPPSTPPRNLSDLRSKSESPSKDLTRHKGNEHDGVHNSTEKENEEILQLRSQLSDLLRIVKELSSKRDENSADLQAAILQGFSLHPNERDEFFGEVARGLSWEDLDEEVSKQNEALDRSLDARRGSQNTVKGPPDVQLGHLRDRLRDRLRKLLHESNSIRIRSNAMAHGSPVRPSQSSPFTPSRTTSPSSQRTSPSQRTTSPSQRSPEQVATTTPRSSPPKLKPGFQLNF
eukprot:m.259005 g.259005  ORF g.259005 m.259005 type:complete len:697 (-) comp16200_c0_seq10:199-2289(-)